MDKISPNEFQRIIEGLDTLLDKTSPTHFCAEQALSIWFDAQIAMDVLDAVKTDEQLQALGYALAYQAVHLKHGRREASARGFEYLVSAQRVDAEYFPLAYEGHSLCNCFCVMSGALAELVTRYRIFLLYLFPGATNPREPQSRSAFRKAPLFRPYPTALVQMIQYVDQKGRLDSVKQNASKPCERLLMDAEDCNVCRVLLHNAYG